MTFSPPVRKLALTAHVVASVGWLGAVAAFLALAAAGLASQDQATVRGAYAAMGVVASAAILPLCLATLATGILQSLGTPWGLVRHHWVVAKLAITAASTLLLLVHLEPIALLADAAAAGPLAPGDHRGARVKMVAASALAIVALLVATALSVYKPAGMTRYGWRKARTQQDAGPPTDREDREPARREPEG